LKVAGDYFSYITTFGKKRISKIDYRIITGWVKFEDITMSNIVDGPIEMAIYYIMVVGGDIQYGARTPVDLSRVFVLEGNKERLFTIEDLMEIKKDKMWTFEYYEPEGTVGHNKIILQKPIIQEREITVKESHQVASFGGESKDKIFLLKLATAQGIKSISDSRYSSDYYNYIIGISNIESKDNTKVNGIDQVLAANVNKFSDSQF